MTQFYDEAKTKYSTWLERLDGDDYLALVKTQICLDAFEQWIKAIVANTKSEDCADSLMVSATRMDLERIIGEQHGVGVL